MSEEILCKICKMSGLSKTEEKNGLCSYCMDDQNEEDFLTGKTCNPNDPEECESCQ